MAKKQADDLVDAGSEYSFPASDPPSYMGSIAVSGPPPEDGAPPHEHVLQELSDPAEAKRDSPVPHASDHLATGTQADDSEELIRRRAYEIWESEGRSGESADHWHRAAQEIRGRVSPGGQSDSSPSSVDAEKMAEQVAVAMDARKARSKQTTHAGATRKRDSASGKAPPRRTK